MQAVAEAEAKSRPARVARIETTARLKQALDLAVAARTGRADRNNSLFVKLAQLAPSRPARVARIETSASSRTYWPPWVAARTGRADRNPLSCRRWSIHARSRPARVARIETPPSSCSPASARSRPARVARIETAYYVGSNQGSASRPARVARIETYLGWRPALVLIVAARTGRADRNGHDQVTMQITPCRGPHGSRG